MNNRYPKLELAGGTVGLRYFSTMNDFIDFVVFVYKEDEEKAEKAIIEAMDEFWEADDLCFGDSVEAHLHENGIRNFYFDFIEQDEYGEVDTDEWESHLESAETPIRIVRD
jgi:hypothetical protein